MAAETSAFDEALKLNSVAWDHISDSSADAMRSLWSTAQAPFDAIENAAKISTDPAAREQAWNSVTDAADRASQLANNAGAYGAAVADDPATLFRDARDGAQAMVNRGEADAQDFVNRQVDSYDQAAAAGDAKTYWAGAVGDVVSGAAWAGVGGPEKEGAEMTEGMLAAKSDEAVSAVKSCPEATRDWSNVAGASWEGRIHRLNDTAYGDQAWNPRDNPDPLKRPYRFTGNNGLAGAYASTDLETPLAETVSGYEDIIEENTGYKSVMPISKDVKLENYVDLTDESVRQQLNLSLEDLLSDDRSITQQIGTEAYMAGFNGIIAPSAKNEGGKNIVSFGGF